MFLFCFFQRVTADLDLEKSRLGEMQQMDVIAKAIAYRNNRRSEAEVGGRMNIFCSVGVIAVS